jgi:hypothetical protein
MGLEVCSSGHEEIAYNEEYRGGRRSKCPLCEAAEVMDRMLTALDQIADMEAEDGETASDAVEATNTHWRDAIKAATP